MLLFGELVASINDNFQELFRILKLSHPPKIFDFLRKLIFNGTNETHTVIIHTFKRIVEICSLFVVFPPLLINYYNLPAQHGRPNEIMKIFLFFHIPANRIRGKHSK